MTDKGVCLSCFFQLFTDYSKVSTVGYFYLSRICRHYPSTGLARAMPKIVPYLMQGLQSPFAETRKAVVDCLVEIYQVLRDDLFSFLQDLTVPQKKLLIIYIERSRAKINK